MLHAILRIGKGDPEIAEYTNPEIAKLAARFAISDEHSLTGISTADELIRQDIEHIFESSNDERRLQWRVFSYLAIVNQLKTKDLKMLLNVSTSELHQCAQQLSGYLGKPTRSEVINQGSAGAFDTPSIDSDTVWQISPDIYAEVVFRYCLQDSLEVFNEVIQSVFIEHSYKHLYKEVAANLAVAYQASNQKGSKKLARACITQSNSLLRRMCRDKADSSHIGVCLRHLALGGVPLHLEIFRENSNLLIDSASSEAKTLNSGTQWIAAGWLSSLICSYILDRDSTGTEEVFTTAETWMQIIAKQESGRYTPIEFLENMHSMIIPSLADRGVVPTADRVPERLDEIEAYTERAAINNSHILPSSELMENTYAMAIKNLVNRLGHLPHDFVITWIDEIERRAKIAAQSDTHDQTALIFMRNIYEGAVSNLADTWEDPTTVRVSKWFDEIEKRAKTEALRCQHDTSPMEFLTNFYSGTISKIAVWRRDPTTNHASIWLSEIDKRAKATAAEENVYQNSELNFLINFYSSALTDLTEVDQDVPNGSASLWLREVEKQVMKTARTYYTGAIASVFLINVCSIAIRKIINKRNDVREYQTRKQIDDIVKIISTIAGDNSHNETQEEFTVKVYSLSIAELPDTLENPTTNQVSARLNMLIDRISANISSKTLVYNVYSRAAAEIVARTLPGEDFGRVQILIDHALSNTDNSADQYHQFIRDIMLSSESSSTWMSWLVNDVLDRTVWTNSSPIGGRTEQVHVLARILALVTHHRWIRSRNLQADTHFKRVVDIVKTVKTDDSELFERIVEETSHLLEEEFTSDIASLEWKEACS